MSIRVAIAGVGNCASSLVQGVEYYKDTKDEDKIPGLMHNNFGGYRVRDIEFVAAFDVDALKVGKDLSEAIEASQNNTIKFADVPNLGVEVLRGPTNDGLGEYYRQMIEESDASRSTWPRCCATRRSMCSFPTCRSVPSRPTRHTPRPPWTPDARS